MFTAIAIQTSSGGYLELLDGDHRTGECHGLHGTPAPRRITRTRTSGTGEVNETRYYASRQPVFNGLLTGTSATALWAVYDELLQALWGMVSQERLLKWTRADGKALQSMVKLGDAFDPVLRSDGGGRSLAYQVVFDREDPRNYAQALDSSVGAALGDVGGGFGFLHGFPFGFTPGGSGSVVVPNDGTIETPAVFTIRGAISNPSIQQQSTGKVIALSGDLGAGSTLVIDCHEQERTVLLDGTADRGNLIDFAATDWTAGMVPPGGDTYKLLGTSWDASARLDVASRDAYA